MNAAPPVPPSYELLNRIAYSLSWGEIPKITLPSRNKEYNRYSLLNNDPFSLYVEDLFEHGHLKTEYKNYLLEKLNPALRTANRGDFSNNHALVQGAAEYFVLYHPNGSSKLIYITACPSLIGFVPTQTELSQAKARLQSESFTPSNIPAAELARQRQTRRPYGELRY